jgi:hypothetical protein
MSRTTVWAVMKFFSYFFSVVFFQHYITILCTAPDFPPQHLVSYNPRPPCFTQTYRVCDMVSATEHRFRFLDLPAELRYCVYEQIEFPTTWHVLDRIDSFVSKRDWSVPPKKQVFNSRIALIRPHTERSIEILLTCHLINDEARSILKRRVAYMKSQPVRYLVDYSAAWAMVGSLGPCLGIASLFTLGRLSVRAKTFVRTCCDALYQTRQRPDGMLTINYATDVVYGRETLMAMALISDLEHLYYLPTRLVVVYKSPLPELQFDGDIEKTENNIEETFLQDVPRELGKSHMATGVFVRPLKEEAFEKHLEGLEIY